MDSGTGRVRNGKEADMTKNDRTATIALIDADTQYEAASVCFHRDGTISALLDADKTFNAPEKTRYVVARVSEFANGANPFRA